MVFLDLLALIIIGLVIWAVVSVVNWARTRLDRNRSDAVESAHEVKEVERQLYKAENALRRIANSPDADPTAALTASIALDEITSYHDSKELSE